MKCPHCNKEIEYALAYSQAMRRAYLKNNTIEKWGELEDWGDNYTFDCPKCGGDILGEIEVEEK